MIAKVSFICAVMVAVRPRSLLYGTSILDLVSSTNATNVTYSNCKSRHQFIENSFFDQLDFSVGDIRIKILKSVELKVETGVSSTKLEKSIPTLQKFQRKNYFKKHEREDLKDVHFETAQVELFGNESTIANDFLDTIKWDFSKKNIYREIPLLAAFGYNNPI